MRAGLHPHPRPPHRPSRRPSKHPAPRAEEEPLPGAPDSSLLQLRTCGPPFRLLNEATGSLLDDVQLVNTLRTSKVTASEVTEQLETSETTEINIDLAREVHSSGGDWRGFPPWAPARSPPTAPPPRPAWP